MVEVDVIAVVISQINMVANMKDWMVDYDATRHIYRNRNIFTFYILIGEGEETVYMGNSRFTPVFEKGKILLKLTFGKILSLSDVLYVPDIYMNLISISFRKGWSESLF